MKLLKLSIITALAFFLLSSCATTNLQKHKNYKFPKGKVTLSDYKIYVEGKLFAELRYFVHPMTNKPPQDKMSERLNARGLSIYYHQYPYTFHSNNSTPTALG